MSHVKLRVDIIALILLTTSLTFLLMCCTQTSRYAEVLVAECLEWCHPWNDATHGMMPPIASGSLIFHVEFQTNLQTSTSLFFLLPLFCRFSDRLSMFSVDISGNFGFLYLLSCLSSYMWGAWGVLLRVRNLRCPCLESILSSPVIHQDFYSLNIVDILEANKCPTFSEDSDCLQHR